MSSLLRRKQLAFTRFVANSGYIDPVTRSWVHASDSSSVDAAGSLQPFSSGKSRLILPDGIDPRDAYLFYTKTEILTSDDGQRADEVSISGKDFVADSMEDWTHLSSKLGHYKVLLVRKDKMGEQP